MEEKLKVQVIENGILLPPQKDKSKSWGLGGVVDGNGNFVEDSIYRFYFGGYYAFDKNAIVDSEEEVIYLGHLIPHWGVFLVDFTRRLWYFYKCKNPNVRLAFFGINMPHGGFAELEQMYHDFLKLADIDEATLIDVKKITRFKTIYVPEMGYDEDKKLSYEEYLTPFRRIIDNINLCQKIDCSKVRDFKTYPKIYLSRTRFATFREAGENIIEKFFELNGFKVIYPETLSFLEKILIFKNADVIASIEGTTAHSILFSEHARQQIIIRKQKIKNSRQPWFNKIMNVPLIEIKCFYEPIPGMPYSWDEGPFLMLFNSELRKFAKENNMLLPSGILKANIKAILHYLHIALIHFLQRHNFLAKIIEPLFVVVRGVRSMLKRV